MESTKSNFPCIPHKQDKLIFGHIKNVDVKITHEQMYKAYQ